MTPRDNDSDAERPELLPASGTAGAALSRVRALCDHEGLDEDVQARVAIVVEELVLNLVEHGGQAGGIALLLARCEAGTRVVIEDRGAPFDPRLARQADLPPERGGGAGIALVLAWSDILSYASADGVNRLELIVRDCE